ncbi:M48 family metalloprotease [Sphingopyxis sp. PET50]|uniref:M48 family metalloprotease n=1 Tax=Sphingopyxis sp. PET50 TaxID=2976533 RepID=UPI0021AFCBD9|nr:M48 family metalloprotease [Sphingopyxis sp. PET50]
MLARLDPNATPTITDGSGRHYRLAAAPGCASSFRIERGGPQAAANGQLVRVTLRLASSIADDAEFAAVVAHELAHNILRHRERLAGGRAVGLVRATEIEADRLSVWLMADAGYDPRAAIRFWERHPKPLIRDASHPPRRERIAAIEAEIEAMGAARATDPRARPSLIAALPPLE